MSDPADMLISVRGEARRAVPPDYGTMSAVIEVTRDSKAAAVHTAAEDLDGLTTDLVAVGGVALEAGTERHPLTWSAQSVTTLVELLITVRAFDLLDRLGAVLTSYETVRVRHIEWDADWDNPAWPDVRAAAIAAAIAKGRDYATALGGSLLAVEHIADGGLLGGSDGHFRATSAAFGRASHARGAEDRGLPSLDPVPQELTAVIEARLVADGVSLSAL